MTAFLAHLIYIISEGSPWCTFFKTGHRSCKNAATNVARENLWQQTQGMVKLHISLQLPATYPFFSTSKLLQQTSALKKTKVKAVLQMVCNILRSSMQANISKKVIQRVVNEKKQQVIMTTCSCILADKKFLQCLYIERLVKVGCVAMKIV